MNVHYCYGIFIQIGVRCELLTLLEYFNQNSSQISLQIIGGKPIN